MNRRWNSRLVCLLWAGLVASIAAPYLQSRSRVTEFFGDEAGWVAASYKTADLFLDGEFGPEQLSEVGDTYGNLNPQLGKLLLGIPLVAYSDAFLDGERFRPTQRYTWRTESYAVKQARGEVPRLQVLVVARTITAAYGVLLILAAAGAARLFCSPPVGLITAALLLSSSLFVQMVTQVMTDVYYNLFLLTGCAASALSLRTASRRGDLVLAVACGLLGGLASAVKVTGFLMVGAAYVPLAILRRLRGTISTRRVLENSAAFAIAALLCTYALNPFYWPDASRIRPREAIEEVRRIVVEGERLELGTPLWTYLSAFEYDRSEIVDRFPQLYNLLRPMEFAIQFLRWKGLVDYQASTLTWRGRRLEMMWTKMSYEYAAFRFAWVFVIVGAAACLKQGRDGWHRGSVSPGIVPVLWFAWNALFLLSVAPRAADRYFLPVVIADRILLAAGLWVIVGFLVRRVGRGWLARG